MKPVSMEQMRKMLEAVSNDMLHMAQAQKMLFGTPTGSESLFNKFTFDSYGHIPETFYIPQQNPLPSEAQMINEGLL